MNIKIILFIIPFFLLSCNERPKIVLAKSNFDFKDSIIYIKFNNSNYSGSDLNQDLAKKILFEHFKRKGFLLQSDLKGDFSELENPKTKGKKCIDFIGIENFNLNNNQKKDAVVSYYNCEPYLNGNCVLPEKAIISDTDNGYKLINENFIPSDFSIDSIINSNNRIFFYCNKWDCQNHKKIKFYRIELKNKN